MTNRTEFLSILKQVGEDEALYLLASTLCSVRDVLNRGPRGRLVAHFSRETGEVELEITTMHRFKATRT